MICRFNKITHTHNNYVLKICRYSGIRYESAKTTAALDYQNIPSPRGLPVVGTTLALMAAGGAPRLHIYADRRHKQLGPMFRDKIGPVSAIFVSDPELMRAVFAQEGKCPIHVLPEAWTLYNETYGCSRGLFFMNGEEWLHHRRIMNKHLLKGDFTWIERACQGVSMDLIERWDLLCNHHEILPHLESELYRWSLNTLAAVLLGHNDYEKHKIELDPLLERLASVVHLIFETSVKFQILPASLAKKLKLASWKKFVRTVDDAMQLANELVNKLIEIPQANGLLTRLKNENLPKPELIRIVVDLVLAAGDTTAYTMAWILYSLAKNKQLQENLKSTSSSVLAKNVIRESLRLYPVAPFLTRILPQNAIVGDYEIPSGTLMLFSIYTSGRDGRFFQNPDTFWPDRWLRENSTTNMQQVCLPFGFGARSCIGKKIADSQLQALVTGIVNKFQLELKNEEDIDVILKMVAVPSQPIRLKLNRI